MFRTDLNYFFLGLYFASKKALFYIYSFKKLNIQLK